MTFGQIYEAGYAVQLYNITTDVRHWHFKDETFQLPDGAVESKHMNGLRVAKIEDVRKAAA